MRLAHSVSRDEGLVHGHSLHRRSDRRVVIYLRQVVSPGAIDREKLDPISYQIPQPFARVVSGAEAVHIVKVTLNQVGACTISRQKQPFTPGVLGHPGFNSLGLMGLIVIHFRIDSSVVRGQIGFVQTLQQLPEQLIGFAVQRVVQGAGRQLQGSHQRMLSIGPGCITSTWVLWGVQTQPTLGNRSIW
jgi:hypothetical protein